MRTSQRRHNDEKIVKRRAKLFKKPGYMKYVFGHYFEVPKQAYYKIKNGHRSEYMYHGCRCDYCIPLDYKRAKAPSAVDWENGIVYDRDFPRANYITKED